MVRWPWSDSNMDGAMADVPCGKPASVVQPAAAGPALLDTGADGQARDGAEEALDPVRPWGMLTRTQDCMNIQQRRRTRCRPAPRDHHASPMFTVRRAARR